MDENRVSDVRSEVREHVAIRKEWKRPVVLQSVEAGDTNLDGGAFADTSGLGLS